MTFVLIVAAATVVLFALCYVGDLFLDWWFDRR